MSDLAIATLPLLGVLLGAALQFWLSRSADREKHTKDLQTQAYADYLRAVAAAAQLRADEDRRNLLRDAADAKTRIAIYGSASVISALARFEEAGAVVTSTGPPAAAIVSLVSSMRPGGMQVTDREIRLLLFGAVERDSR